MGVGALIKSQKAASTAFWREFYEISFLLLTESGFFVLKNPYDLLVEHGLCQRKGIDFSFLVRLLGLEPRTLEV